MPKQKTMHERIADSERKRGSGAYDPRERKDWEADQPTKGPAKNPKGGSAAGAAY